MAQIVVDLLANDRLSPALQNSISQIRGFNAAVLGMKSPNFKGDTAGFKAYNAELATLLRERRDILDRGNQDWTRGSLTPSERGDRAQAQQLADQHKAAQQAATNRWPSSLTDATQAGQLRAKQVKAQLLQDEIDHQNVIRQTERHAAEKRRAWANLARESEPTNRYQGGVGVLPRLNAPPGSPIGGGHTPPPVIARTTEDMERLTQQTQKFQMVGMQAAFAVDDFIAGFQTGGITGGLRGAANNISMIGMQLGGLQGLIIGIGITAAVSLVATVWQKFASGARDAKQAVEGVRQTIDAIRASMSRIPSLTSRMRTPGEIQEDAHRKADTSSPEMLQSELRDEAFEEKQHERNQRTLEKNAQRSRTELAKAEKALQADIDQRPQGDQATGKLDRSMWQVMTFQEGEDRINAPLKERAKEIDELRMVAVESAKALKENKQRLDELSRSRQGLEEAVPLAVKREADEAAKQVKDEADAQQRKQDALERKVQAENRRAGRDENKKLNAQDRLDAIVTGENDPQAGILIEMKDRLELAKEITNEAKRLKQIEEIKKSTLNKLAKDELSGMPKESNERKLGSTALRGSIDAFRTIQTAGAQARSGPEVKHLAAIEKLNKDQLTQLEKLVEKVSSEPLLVVGPD